MIRLTEHIAYLLTCHDCVIVPGWGAFIAQRTSAAYDSVTGVFTPPCRSITFNASITDTDGLLASSVSRRERIPYAKAVESVATEVAALRHQLSNDGELVIPRVGIFRSSDGDATPLFEPMTDNVANIPYVALPAVSSSSVDSAKAIAEIEPVKKFTGYETKKTRRRRFPAFARIAAAFALLLGAGYAVTAPEPEGDHTDYASMTAIPSSARPSELLTDDVQAATELFISQPVDSDASVVVMPEKVVAGHHRVESRPSSTSAPRYCLVVASLPSKALAEKFIASKGDMSLRILESDGRFRVYAAGGSTFADAESYKSKISARYPEAWVCRR